MCFEPLESLEKLAAMIPKPRINLFLYHGVVAPHARLRPDVVRRARRASADAPGPEESLSGAPQAAVPVRPASPPGEPSESPASARPPPRKRFAWADLLRRTFASDVLACQQCGGQLRLISTIDGAVVIEKILRHLGLPTTVPDPAPARWQQSLPGMDDAADWRD